MRRKKATPQSNLDHGEKKLLASFEKDEWKSVKNIQKAKTHARHSATATLRKDVRIYHLPSTAT